MVWFNSCNTRRVFMQLSKWRCRTRKALPMLKNNTYVLTSLLFGCLTLTACGGFKDMEAESGAAFSNDGTRAAGVMQRWEGSCNENSRWHLIPGVGDWCGEYDDAGFSKNHRFQIWVTGGEISPLAGAHQYFEESDGHFTQELEGEVVDIEYVSSAIHHIVQPHETK